MVKQMKRVTTFTAIAATAALAGQLAVLPVHAQGLFNYTITGQVFNDLNRNGLKDEGDNPISGVQVTLYQDGVALDSYVANTDENGNYVLAGVPEGEGYSLTFTKESLLNADISTEAANDSFTLDEDKTFDVGFFEQPYVGGTIWLDQNGDGEGDLNPSQEAKDEIAKVEVTLGRTGTDETISTVSPDANGNYHFLNLEPGEYVLSFKLPDTLEFTVDEVRESNGVLRVEIPEDYTLEGIDTGYANIVNAFVKLVEADNANDNEANDNEDADQTSQPDLKALIPVGLIAAAVGIGATGSSAASTSSTQPATQATQATTPTQAAQAADASHAKQQGRTALANTGASVLGVIVIALALVGLGVLLVGRRRKDDEDLQD